ncbi:MAG: endonuclease/exonuclease/phosphatase family protein [Bryobacteraceae bacterium]
MRRIRAVTYNIHKCRGMDGRVKPARIAEVLRQIDADVIALQEVLWVPDRSPELDQARYLADQLGFNVALGENRKIRGGAYGNVVLSRYGVRSHCNFDISVRGREQRGCLRTDVELEPKLVMHVFNVHLGTAFLERRHQARRLLEAELIGSRELEGPRLVMGDFNEWTSGLTTQLLTTEFRGADIRAHLGRSVTYPGVIPFMHLDHIYYDDDLALESVRVHRTRTALMASDHLPLVADFALRERSR